MGGGASKNTQRDWEQFSGKGVDAELIQNIVETLDNIDDQESAAATVNTCLAELYEKIKSDSDDPGFAVIKITKADKVRIVEAPQKKKALQQYKKAVRKNATAILIKNGTVQAGKCHGDSAKVAFLIGVAFGKGWSDLGPLNDEGSKYCVFNGGGDEDDDGEDEDDDGADPDEFALIRVDKAGSGIRDRIFKKKKQAMKAFKKVTGKKDCEAILVNQKKIIEHHWDEGESEGKKRVAFLVGCAYGRGIIDDLGPLEDSGPFPILEADFDEDE